MDVFTSLVVASTAMKRSYAAYVERFMFSSIPDCTTNGNCAIITHSSYLVQSFKGSFNRWVNSSTCVACLYFQNLIPDLIFVGDPSTILSAIVDRRGALAPLVDMIPIGRVADVDRHVSAEDELSRRCLAC